MDAEILNLDLVFGCGINLRLLLVCVFLGLSQTNLFPVITDIINNYELKVPISVTGLF